MAINGGEGDGTKPVYTQEEARLMVSSTTFTMSHIVSAYCYCFRTYTARIGPVRHYLSLMLLLLFSNQSKHLFHHLIVLIIKSREGWTSRYLLRYSDS